MRTIERNYRKNPHTARWLMTFHAAAQGLPAEIDDNAAEYELAAGDGAPTDLLDTVPVDHVADHRSDAQKNYMEQLIASISELDAELGRKAREYTDGMTERGLWTPGREGKASVWISRLIAKRDALRAAAPRTPATPVQVADGRYAVEEDGVLKFFHVKNGRKPGVVFLDVRASDDLYPIRDRARRERVLATIAVDPAAAQMRYGVELGRCYACGRTLTDPVSRDMGIGPDCRAR